MTLYTRLQLLRAGIVLTPIATAPVALAAGIDDASIGYRFEHRSEDSPMLHDAFMEALATYQGLRHDRS